jgi:hypothetical protein
MILWLSTLVARAQSVADDVASARDAILREDYESALDALDAAEDRAPGENAPVAAPLLAGIPYLRGIVLVRQGDPRGEAIDRWRDTLAIQNDLPWDTTLVPNGDERASSKRCARRSRIVARSTWARRRPRASPGSTSTAVACTRATRRSRGDTWRRSPVRTERRAAAGPTSKSRCAGSSSAPEAWTRPSSSRRRQATATTFGLLPDWSDESEPVAAPAPAPTENVARVERRSPSQTTLLSSGGALVAVGFALDLFWVLPAYADIEDARSNPDSITRAEADELTKSYQAARWTTIGVIGAGVVVAGSSLFVHPAGAGLAIDGVW